MNILKKLSKDSRGFGHIEMIVIVLVVAAIAGVGFFVYQNHSKSGTHSTAHAGGWSQIEWVSQGSTYPVQQYTIQACYTPINAFGTTINQVKVGIINNGHTNLGSFTIFDESGKTFSSSQYNTISLNSGQAWAFFPTINMVPSHYDSVDVVQSETKGGPTILPDPTFGNPYYYPYVYNHGKATFGGKTNLSLC